MTQQVKSELIKIKDVMNMTTFSRNTVYKLIGRGEFPRQLKVGAGSYWRRKEVEQWLDDLMPATDKQVQLASEQAANAARRKTH
jgi:prophage regulatory protein